MQYSYDSFFIIQWNISESQIENIARTVFIHSFDHRVQIVVKTTHQFSKTFCVFGNRLQEAF
ncbi:hypothetical protein D3C76_1336270 [compost metagenome]